MKERKLSIALQQDNILKVVSDKLEKKAVELREEVNLNHDKLLQELIKQQEKIQQYVDNVEGMHNICCFYCYTLHNIKFKHT